MNIIATDCRPLPDDDGVEKFRHDPRTAADLGPDAPPYWSGVIDIETECIVEVSTFRCAQRVGDFHACFYLDETLVEDGGTGAFFFVASPECAIVIECDEIDDGKRDRLLAKIAERIDFGNFDHDEAPEGIGFVLRAKNEDGSD